MTDRDRFHLHILPGMPATREGAMRGPRITVPSIDALGAVKPVAGAIYVVSGHGAWRYSAPLGPDNSGTPIIPPKLEARRAAAATVYWNAETYDWQTTPPKRKKRKR